MPHARNAFAFAALLSALASLALAKGEGRWVAIDREDGIQTWALEIPGREMPGFRGRTIIDGEPEAILNAITQVEHHTEWMHRCAEARTIRTIDEDHTIVYNRTDAPWPAWDRDVVLETEITRQAGGARVNLHFQDVEKPHVPVPDRVVRMPRLEGSYLLERVDEAKTRVTYTIEVDIGGSIPTWIAKRLARDMPYETLYRLRERVE